VKTLSFIKISFHVIMLVLYKMSFAVIILVLDYLLTSLLSFHLNISIYHRVLNIVLI
jgi:hypothetical protein